MLASSTRMLRNAKRECGHQRRQEAALRQSQDREDKSRVPMIATIPQGPQPQHGFGSQVFRVNIDIRPSLGKQNGRRFLLPVLDDLCSLLCVVGMECGIRISHGGFFL